MTYSFNVTEDFKVIVKDGNKKIDEIGAFDSLESANYWAGEIAAKFADNPEAKYPGE